MTKPLPFTFSSLDTFKNCPAQFHRKYVVKDVKDVPGPQAIYGTNVHKAFEEYLSSSGAAGLPDDLLIHQNKLMSLLQKDGIFWCEEKVALGKDLKPCRYDDPDRLWRGNADFLMVDRSDHTATIVDFKTGKKHDKWAQIAMYAIHTFAHFPDVQLVNAQFYWTQTQSTTKKIWGRAEIGDLWLYFLADLRQYKEAFKTDTWQERPSGLCNGFCPVRDCQHWRPRRER